ncbi:molybdopterin guanine dinucleotide biosynthesis accessory protein MobB [Cohaesibacter sp. ES.047]|uniref:molybdopterin-guanine dinucleotide biosynthesis protein B n=1 Tax=Cohaesibacter sp. ES.047 TaxID=1798205 RepID=UPI000BB87E53|nr:molybdopterin-guanine dinucleotide biosynthesis protein B [Cohaesibacter sp. ES.047]SNY93024.1 molybdopterin guanine dinucleotide biosynthesis accessory protein MobB [Cohaesibacter sp. ES.047]
MDKSFQDFRWYGHRVFGVTGWKNSGKTTLATRLIAELTARGYRISSVKHAHHNCDIDKEGTDSYRHREAGSGEVALVAAGKRWAIMHEARDDEETSLGEILPRLAPCDLVLVEGYKTEPFPKIEVRRADAKHTTPIAPDDNRIVAVASDQPELLEDAAGLDCFQIDDVKGMADMIVEQMGLEVARADGAH